ncbi:MAG: helix-turn-helix domain-containing protein [Actinomycetota bacterium]
MGEDGWKSRLREAVRASGKPMRTISLEAGLGPTYLAGIFNEDKEPTISRLIQVCRVLNVSLSRLVDGYELDAQTERLLAAWANLSAEQKVSLLGFLTTLRK